MASSLVVLAPRAVRLRTPPLFPLLRRHPRPRPRPRPHHPFSTTTTTTAAAAAAPTFQKAPAPAPPAAPAAPPQLSLPASYYRGGTSRAIMLKPSDLPPLPSSSSSSSFSPSSAAATWGPIFLKLIGSPDPLYGRQLDGMGGGVSSLSKICVVGPVSEETKEKLLSSRSKKGEGEEVDVDVEYTFAALGVRDDEVDMSGNCGNMSAAVGAFAVDAGIFIPSPRKEQQEEREGNMVTVRIFNTNTEKIIHARFPLDSSGRNAAASSAPGGFGFKIDGVADEDSAPVELRFVDPAGSKTGKLFPTGRVVEEFEIFEEEKEGEEGKEGGGGKGKIITTIRGTCIDVGNPAVFVEARDLGVRGTMTPAEIDEDERLKRKLELIRRKAAVRMGMVATGKEEDVQGSIPKIGFVSRPEAPSAEDGGKGEKVRGNVTVRAMSVGQPHKAVPVTTALALAAAANIKGTTVAGCLVGKNEGKEEGKEGPEIVINHASGTLTVAAEFDDGKGGGEQRHLRFATVYRTARRLMEGRVFYKG